MTITANPSIHWFLKMTVSKFSFLVFVFCTLSSFSQLSIVPTWNKNPLKLKDVYFTENKDSISFSALKMYLSDFRFQERESGQIKTIDTLIFYDLSDSSTHTFLKDITIENYETLTFTLGLDSAKNVSGELENAYDPLLGMYWAWNTGYINLKLMGKSNASLSKTQNFEFHLGGYRSPFPTAQNVKIALNDQQIHFDVSQLFSKYISLKKLQYIMLPGREAFLISQGLPFCFH